MAGKMQGGGPGIMPLSIKLLGLPEVSLEGRSLRFGRKKALALLSYLAAGGGRRPRGELAGLLWPASEGRRARTDLRSILTSLRKTLEDGGTGDRGLGGEIGLLAIEGDLLGVELREVELDLRTLEAAVSMARRETAGTSPMGRSVEAATGHRDTIAGLEGALEAYRGEFMEGFTLGNAPEFELWLEAERARWRDAFGELCERLSRLQVETGRLEKATETARVWARHAPSEEAAHLRLVEILSAAGDAEGALLSYQHFRDARKRDLGIEPPLRMRELAERLRGEVEGRASLGASLARWETAPSLFSALDVPFVGRHEEFGVLVSEYHACLSGSMPRVVALIGEAGIGKTRLAEEFLGWVEARGADVLEGTASEGARLPYAPLVEAVRARMERERAPDDLLEDTWLAELSRLLPELKERYPDLPSPASGEGEPAKGALFEAVARTGMALASRAALVLFLDDLQWTDAATLEVLDYAGRRWAEQGVPVLLLITARLGEPEAASSIERWRASLRRRVPVRDLVLTSLDNEDVEGMLRRLARIGSGSARTSEEPAVSDQTSSELQRFGKWLALETGGQPFYLIETLKALLENRQLAVRACPEGGALLSVGPALSVESDSGSLLPQSVREVIRSRLSRLSPAASELLRAGAVLGRRFGFDLLRELTGLGEAEGLRGLDELVERRLFVEETGGQEQRLSVRSGATYSFSHEKIRQVTYTDCGQARRWVLHRRAFEVLEGSDAPPAELARHALAAGLVEEAFACSVAAGDDAVDLFAMRDATVHYERAREMLGEGRRTERVEAWFPNLEHLYTQLGRAYELTDAREKAREAHETMRAVARAAGDVRLEVVSLNHLAVFYFQHEGDLSRARLLLKEALEAAREANLAGALAETECNLADATGLWTGDFERAWPLAEKALASARALGRPYLVARVLTALSRMKLFAGRLEEAEAHAREGATLSRELAERAAPTRTELPSILTGAMGLAASRKAGVKAMEIQCLVYLAHIRFYQGRLREGLAMARDVRSIAEKQPQRMEMMSLWAVRTGLQETGEYEEALALARRGTALAREARDVYMLGANLGRLGEAYEALQNLEEARAAYEEASERGQYGPFSHARFCVLAALAGEWIDAHAHAVRAHEVGTFFNPMFSIHLHHGVEALLRGGDEVLARAEVHRLAERAEKNGRDRMSYLRCLAVLDECNGDTGAAMGHLREAEALAEKIGLPGELWQIRAKIGEFHERRGEVDEAREAFSRAARTLEALAQKIGDEELRDGFLSAPRVRRVLERG